MDTPPFKIRKDDPPGTDPRPRREPNPALWEWEAAYGKATLRGRGLLFGFLFFGALMLGSVWYLGLRLEASVGNALSGSMSEHGQLVQASSQTNCILTMTPEERILFRNDLRPDAWSRWCWWISRDIRGTGP